MKKAVESLAVTIMAVFIFVAIWFIASFGVYGCAFLGLLAVWFFIHSAINHPTTHDDLYL